MNQGYVSGSGHASHNGKRRVNLYYTICNNLASILVITEPFVELIPSSVQHNGQTAPHKGVVGPSGSVQGRCIIPVSASSLERSGAPRPLAGRKIGCSSSK